MVDDCRRCRGSGVVENAPDAMPVSRVVADLYLSGKIRRYNNRVLMPCPVCAQKRPA